MTVTTLACLQYPTNSKPEIIIPTGSSYVLDELYQGECIQIGGTRDNNKDMHLPTHLYIKCVNQAGEIKYVQVTNGIPENKIVIFSMKNLVLWDLKTYSMKSADIYTCLGYYKNTDELFSANDSEHKMANIIFGYHPEANNNPYLPDLEFVLTALERIPELWISVVDKIEPTFDYWRSHFSTVFCLEE